VSVNQRNCNIDVDIESCDDVDVVTSDAPSAIEPAPLLSSLADGVLTLTLNRPARRNALSLPLLKALGKGLADGAADDNVRVVLLTGAGVSFCAGGDTKVFARGESIFGAIDEPGERRGRQVAMQRMTTEQLWDFPKPTVALLNGHAVGAGLALALACDLRVATASAQLRTGFSPLGLAGDFGCTWLLNQLVGRSRALELLYLSEPLGAARAEALGLVNLVVPEQEVADRGQSLARELATRSRPAITAIKDNVDRAQRSTLRESANAEVEWLIHLLATDEHRAAAAAAR